MFLSRLKTLAWREARSFYFSIFRIAEQDRASHPHTEFCQVRLLDQYQKIIYTESN